MFPISKHSRLSHLSDHIAHFRIFINFKRVDIACKSKRISKCSQFISGFKRSLSLIQCKLLWMCVSQDWSSFKSVHQWKITVPFNLKDECASCWYFCEPRNVLNKSSCWRALTKIAPHLFVSQLLLEVTGRPGPGTSLLMPPVLPLDQGAVSWYSYWQPL